MIARAGTYASAWPAISFANLGGFTLGLLPTSPAPAIRRPFGIH